MRHLSDGFRLYRRTAPAARQRRPAARRPLRLSTSARPIWPSPRAGAGRCGRSTPSSASSACRLPRSMAASAAAAIEIMLVMEAFGRALALEPYLATVVLGGTALRLAGSDGAESGDPAASRRRQADARLRAWRAAGALRPDRRADDGASRRPAAGCSTAPRASSRMATAPTGWSSAPAPPASATTPTASRLFLVDATANGVARRGYPMRDGTRAAEISLSGVEVGARRRARRGRRRRCRSSSGWSRPASPRPPPRRSARWRRCRR